jgi:site-specific DNA-methyltransferase (adenine-specific)
MDNFFENKQIKIYNADCLDVLKQLEDNSIDSVISDPPAGISFMNLNFDSDKGGRDQWIKWLTEIMNEVNRVLKPGGHILIWSIPRTQHWTATAIENAGFEIRDVIDHVFSTGWPKALNISKQIDKQAGVEREVVGFDKTKYRPNSVKTHKSGQSGNFGLKAEGTGIITKPNTEEAQKWDGWFTALKPAHENWILARKQISENNIVDNILKYDTGAINIGDSRVDSYLPGEFEKLSKRVQQPRNKLEKGNFHARAHIEKQVIAESSMSPGGRFPCNLIFSHSVDCNENGCVDGCPIKILDGQSGVTKSNKCEKPSDCGGNTWGGTFQTNRGPRGYNDAGGASRFFNCFQPEEDEFFKEYMPFIYEPKPSGKEKDEGLEGENIHVTVKSMSLMNYLCKLITPPGGTVLDMFMGSGTTGCSAIYWGFNFIGIELEKEYYDISKQRILHWQKKPNLLKK